ncbi:MAG: polymer-forming cytoskeletal protein [Planctomycetota bacterium]
MARALPPKTVQCYHCDHRFEVGGRAQSTSCPGCYKSVIVHDIEIGNQVGPKTELKTCGKIVIKKRGRLICQTVVAHDGLTCEGIIDARTVASRMPVTLGKKSNFKGDLTAPSVDIQAGAVIQPSRFAIGPPIDEDSADPPPESPPDSTEETKT